MHPLLHVPPQAAAAAAHTAAVSIWQFDGVCMHWQITRCYFVSMCACLSGAGTCCLPVAAILSLDHAAVLAEQLHRHACSGIGLLVTQKCKLHGELAVHRHGLQMFSTCYASQPLICVSLHALLGMLSSVFVVHVRCASSVPTSSRLLQHSVSQHQQPTPCLPSTLPGILSSHSRSHLAVLFVHAASHRSSRKGGLCTCLYMCSGSCCLLLWLPCICMHFQCWAPLQFLCF